MSVANIEACLSTGKDDWETPDAFFNQYNARFHFVLDAAANHTNHKCENWFGPGGVCNDALVSDWSLWLEKGNIWMNPPYSKGQQPKFVAKAVKEALQSTNYVVCLLPSRTDTKLFHEVIVPNAEEIAFIKGRLKFKGAAQGAPFPSLVAVF